MKGDIHTTINNKKQNESNEGSAAKASPSLDSLHEDQLQRP